MKFKVDYEHIFFDRYTLTESEKKEEALKILERVLKDELIDTENCIVEICADCAEKEMALIRVIKLLKKEFFLILEEEKIEKREEPDMIDYAEKYIIENYLYEEFCALRVCDRCNMKRGALDDAFKKRFSKSITEYIRDLRVKKAIELIGENEKMEKIAYLCGFGSVKTMQRAFKSVCGMTPGNYRLGRLDSMGSK